MWKRLRGNAPEALRSSTKAIAPEPTLADRRNEDIGPPERRAGVERRTETAGPPDRRQRNDRRQRDMGLPPGVVRDRRHRVEQRKPQVEEIPMSEWEAHRADYFAAVAPVMAGAAGRGNPEGLVEWGPDMESGAAAIDGQNRALVTKLNAINLWIKAGESPAFLREILREFLSYVRSHYEDQLRYLHETAHPRAAAHTAIHRRMLGELNAQFIRYESNELDAAALHRTLAVQLVAHIEDDDSQIGRLSRLSGSR